MWALLPIAALDLVVYFLPMHRHLCWGFDSNFDDVSVDTHHRHLDASINYDAFPDLRERMSMALTGKPFHAKF
jgi:hypothetical protein